MDAHVAKLTVKLGGSTQLTTDTREKLETRAGDGIVSITVDLRLDQPDMFSVEYDMMALEKINLLDSLKPGDEVEIGIALDKATTPILFGEVAYIEPNFDNDRGNFTVVSGYHKIHRLTRGQRSKTWGQGLEADQVATTPVKDVINDSKANVGSGPDKIKTGEVGASQLKHHYVPQLNVSDFEFLQAIGASLEMKAGDSSATEVTFRKPAPSATAEIKVGRDRADQGGSGGAVPYLSLNFRLSTVQQYAAVEVRSWDFVKKKNIVAKVTSSTYTFPQSNPGHAEAGTALYASASAGRKYVVVDQPVNTQEEAKQIAQSLFDQFSMDFLTGEVTIEGDPKALPGKMIEFVGFGKAYSGVYMITSATHSYRAEDGYKTTIAFARNAKGT